jgi:heme/copper-type cytochrome/quinol oxidase subunit 2
MKKIKALILFTLGLFLSFLAQAQNPNASVEMADVLHQNGKIYLVVLVLVTIFAGVLFMLIRIERKLNKLEKENN